MARLETMPIADWIKDATRKRRERWIEEGRREGRREGYLKGYSDFQEGKPPQPPDSEKANGAGGN